MLITLFTSIPASRTEPDLGLFSFAGDDVFFLARKGSAHRHSPFFQVSHLKNKVMDAYGDRISCHPMDIGC
jgi:hypothetical protein